MENELEHLFNDYNDLRKTWDAVFFDMLRSFTQVIKSLIDSKEDVVIRMKNGDEIIAKIVAVDEEDALFVFEDSIGKTRCVESIQFNFDYGMKLDGGRIMIPINEYRIDNLRLIDWRRFFEYNPETVYIGKEYETMRDL